MQTISARPPNFYLVAPQHYFINTTGH